MKHNTLNPTTAAVLSGLLAVFSLAESAAAKPPPTVVLPAGSVNGLATAIATAGPGGTVLIQSGVHDEAGTVTVSIPVDIVGESGAVLRCGTTPSPLLFPVTPAHVIPTLHVLGADGVTIRGLEFVPAGAAANCALLIEQANGVRVLDNHISGVSGHPLSGFQFGILVHHGDRVRIDGNTVQCAPLWAVDPQFGFVVVGIEVLNGEFARLEDNAVSGAFFGIFGNDRAGRMARNHVAGCYIGFQFCHSLYGIIDVAVSGTPLGADVACTGWHAQDNESTGNFLCGYLVIDGANNNVLANNAASGNPLDIILTGDGDFYGVGIPMPASHHNTVAQGSPKGLTIMDCGDSNTLSGGVTPVPCP